MSKKIPTNVFLLGLVSFFNDTASEMIYPIVPIFLTTVLGAPVAIVGLIEGIAESTASITKYFFGAVSDYFKKRKIFVVLGYGFSALSKILIGLSFTWPLVLFAKFIDRVGKGLRTAPRDSLLLQSTKEENRGFIFGFHRALDSLGAVVGPLVALVLLYYFKENMRLTFFLAFISAFFGVLLLLIFVKEKKVNGSGQNETRSLKLDWKNTSSKFKSFLLVTFLFSVGNSSDAFIILNAKNLGFSTLLVVLTYVLYNISQAIFAIPLGSLSDKIGADRVFRYGLVVFTVVYFFFGFVKNPYWLWILFPIYGIYIAATDGVAKAYIAGFIKEGKSGSYFGLQQTITAVGNFFASVIGGILWSKINPSSTFYYGSIMAAVAFIVFFSFEKKRLR